MLERNLKQFFTSVLREIIELCADQSEGEDLNLINAVFNMNVFLSNQHIDIICHLGNQAIIYYLETTEFLRTHYHVNPRKFSQVK